MEESGRSRIPLWPACPTPHSQSHSPAAFLGPSCHLSLERLPETPEATTLAPSRLSRVCFCDYSHGVLAGRSVGAPPAHQLTTSKVLEGASSTLGLQALVGGALPPVVPVQTEDGRGIQQGRQHPVQFAGRVLLSGVGLHVSELLRCQAGCD